MEFVPVAGFSRWDELLEFAEKLRSESVKMGIPAIHFSDAMALQAVTFLEASRGSKVYLDLGAGIGYSTLWIALGAESGCADGGCTVIAAELDEEKSSMIVELARALKLKNVELKVYRGDALKLLSELEDEGVDLAFVDIEKHEYPAALELLSRKLRRGGIALFHNAFHPPPPPTFFSSVFKEPWRTVILPTEPGMVVAIKKL